MEECQAIAQYLPRRSHGVSPAGVTPVDAPTPEPREAFSTHPLFSCSIPNKFHQIKTIPLNLVDLIKTSAVKTLWEKHLLVGKRVPTHACRQDARTRSTNKLLSSSNSSSHAPPFLCQRAAPPFPEVILVRRIRILRMRVELSESSES